MRETQTVVLDWPPAALSPNARVHWSKLARAKKAYRQACWVLCKEQGIKPMTGPLHVSLTFVPPTRRAYDLDNALARMKSGLDGLADVLGVDDQHWSLTIRKGDAGQIGGMVRVMIEGDHA